MNTKIKKMKKRRLLRKLVIRLKAVTKAFLVINCLALFNYLIYNLFFPCPFVIPLEIALVTYLLMVKK